MTYLHEFMKQSSLHSGHIVAAAEIFLYHRRACTFVAVGDQSARQKQVWMQYQESCILENVSSLRSMLEHLISSCNVILWQA